MNSTEWRVAIAGALLILGLVVWRWLRDWLARPVTPDPWGAEISTVLDQPETRPVCLRCQCPHEDGAWFCPVCGHAVGDYNNLNPYLYIFSVGEVLREGTSGRIRKSWLTTAGFVLLALAEYTVLAPIYWFHLFRNAARQRHSSAAGAPPTLAQH